MAYVISLFRGRSYQLLKLLKAVRKSFDIFRGGFAKRYFGCDILTVGVADIELFAGIYSKVRCLITLLVEHEIGKSIGSVVGFEFSH